MASELLSVPLNFTGESSKVAGGIDRIAAPDDNEMWGGIVAMWHNLEPRLW